MDFAWYYVLAAKGIQDFILQGDRLKLMTGGSELIENLPNDFLNSLLQKLDLKEGVDYRILSRAAGGARLVFSSREKAQSLARIVPLAVQMYLPGVDVVQDLRMIENGLAHTMDNAEKKLQQRRNILFPVLPVAGPLAARSARSGLPVSGKIKKGENEEDADIAMIVKNRASQGQKGLLKKTLSNREISLKKPEDIEDIMGRSKDGYIAVFHADGNGLGATVMALLDDLKKMDDITAGNVYADFSGAVSRAAEQAMQKALEPVIQKAVDNNEEFLPFRPLVCAGDDVTLILRAEDALSVAEIFLNEFEESSRKALESVSAPSLKGKSLSAAAGIAFVHRKYPFSQAYSLCESLCSYAKDATGRQGSSLAFWRVTSSAPDDFSGILKRELTSDEGILMTMMPYRTGCHAASPSLSDLQRLVSAVNHKNMPGGNLREMLGLLYSGRAAVDHSYERMRDILLEGSASDAFRKLEEALAGITGNRKEPLWHENNGTLSTPLHDASEIIAACFRYNSGKGDI